jgi:hypothetical protein
LAWVGKREGGEINVPPPDIGMLRQSRIKIRFAGGCRNTFPHLGFLVHFEQFGFKGYQHWSNYSFSSHHKTKE